MATLGLLERTDGKTRDVHAAYPPLPHLVQNARTMIVGVTFDREAILPLVPKGVEPLDEATGGFNFIDAPEGWGITPYRVAWAFIDIKGLTSETGASCRHYVYGFVEGSEAAVAYYRQARGVVAMHEGEDEWVASAGPVGNVRMRVRGRVCGPFESSWSDTRNHLTIDEQGALYISPVSVLADRAASEPISLDILGDDEILQRLRPVRLEWARLTRNHSYTCGAWVPLPKAMKPRATHARGVFVNLLARFDRAAALVERDCGVVLVNAEAERLIGDGIGVVNGRLHCHLHANQARLNTAIAAALDRNEKVTVSLERPDGGIPLIVRVAPFAFDLPSAQGAKLTNLALLVFTDPAAPLESDTKPALQLLGLTPAEARAAALVGGGLSPREAAAELGQVENSVRTTIKRVYAKLGLSRQSELALLISRIADILG